MSEYPETCWFIERQRWFESVPSYLMSREVTTDSQRPTISYEWTQNPQDAMSFNRRRDAEAFILSNQTLCVLGHAVCHRFMGPARYPASSRFES